MCSRPCFSRERGVQSQGRTPNIVMAGRSSGPSMITASGDACCVEVAPIWIVAFDQIGLPVALILLSDFSRRIAAIMLSCCSHQTSRFNPYFFVNPSIGHSRCCQTRCLRLLVTPMQSVPCFLLLMM